MICTGIVLQCWFSIADAGVINPYQSTAQRLHESALVALRADRLQDAVAMFSQAAEADRQSALFANDLGFALQRLGRRPEAEVEFRRALKLDPARVYATINLVDLLAFDPVGVARRDEIGEVLEAGLAHVGNDAKARFTLQIRLCDYERSHGFFPAARARLDGILQSDALTLAQRKRALDLRESLQIEEGAAAFDEWPTAPPTSEDAATLVRARGLATSDDEGAILVLNSLIGRVPTFAAARTFRATLLEARRRYDEATRDLSIVVQINPQDADGWRRLGLLLARHGGSLEAPRADEALRRALALEPGWTELSAARMALAAPRSSNQPLPPGSTPTPLARRLFLEAETLFSSGDPTGAGRARIEEATRESPGYVKAAVLRFAFTGEIADATVQMLWNDGARLWDLTREITRLSPNDAGQALTRPWVERAANLGLGEALFARALLRQAKGDRAGALSDLTAYVASDAQPPRLDEARALRRTLRPHDSNLTMAPPITAARLHLFADEPGQALRILGAPCTPERSPQTLVEVGKVYEFMGEWGQALFCHGLARRDKGDVGRAALGRYSAVAARAPDGLLETMSEDVLQAGTAAGFLGSRIAQARRLVLAGRNEDAADLLKVDLDIPSLDPGSDLRPVAHELRAKLMTSRKRGASGIARVVGASTAALLLVFLWAWHRRRRGHIVSIALKIRPALFPEISKAVGEIRHDVIKHRTSVLDLATDPAANLTAMRDAILEPEPTSIRVVAIYDRIARAAGALGVSLCDLSSDPIFGALGNDLRRAERALREATDERELRLLLAQVAVRLRDTHAGALASLLTQGPRTRLDATTMDAWLRAQAAAETESRRPWVAPALSLSSTDVTVPVDAQALQSILSNLVRNAQAAVAGLDDPRVLVRVDAVRNVTGQATVSLLVGDVAGSILLPKVFEDRPHDRGLGIVRDLAAAWQGRVIIEKAEPPFTKMVGVAFNS